LCPTTADVFPFEVPIRPLHAARSADQVAVLAKVLFTNSFRAACRKANKSRNQVRPSEFPKD
jgi:hypothetical protein